MAFTRKRIDLQFSLGQGAFGDTGTNTVTLSGLRASAQIQQAGGASMGKLTLRVHGMTLSMMNQLSALTTQVMMTRKNSVTVSAGDDVSGVAAVFAGEIAEAWVDANSAPDVAFHVGAFAGLLQAVQPVPPTSYPGHADCATIMAGLATLMGLKFESNNVSVQLSTPYFPGSPRDQAMRCADAANVNWVIDNGTLAIWPKGGSRGGTVPLISPDTGMIGFPQFNGVGIAVNTLFNPTIAFGQTVQVQSSLTVACGNWFVSALVHNLESETPGGAWMTQFQGAPLYASNVVAK
jgi:hypothetical protein